MLSHFLKANSAVKTAKRFFDIIKKARGKIHIFTFAVNKKSYKNDSGRAAKAHNKKRFKTVKR